MKEIKYILTTMTENSLAIIDELCRSTSLEEGMALAMAICEAFATTSIFLYITTHFTTLAKLADMYLNIKVWQMECIAQGDTPQTVELDYKYAIKTGVTTVYYYGIYLVRNIWPDSVLELVNETMEKTKNNVVKSLEVKKIDPRIRLKYDLECNLKHLKKKGVLTISVINKNLNEYMNQLDLIELSSQHQNLTLLPYQSPNASAIHSENIDMFIPEVNLSCPDTSYNNNSCSNNYNNNNLISQDLQNAIDYRNNLDQNRSLISENPQEVNIISQDLQNAINYRQNLDLENNEESFDFVRPLPVLCRNTSTPQPEIIPQNGSQNFSKYDSFEKNLDLQKIPALVRRTSTPQSEKMSQTKLKNLDINSIEQDLQICSQVFSKYDSFEEGILKEIYLREELEICSQILSNCGDDDEWDNIDEVKSLEKVPENMITADEESNIDHHDDENNINEKEVQENMIIEDEESVVDRRFINDEQNIITDDEESIIDHQAEKNNITENKNQENLITDDEDSHIDEKNNITKNKNQENLITDDEESYIDRQTHQKLNDEKEITSIPDSCENDESADENPDPTPKYHHYSPKRQYQHHISPKIIVQNGPGDLSTSSEIDDRIVQIKIKRKQKKLITKIRQLSDNNGDEVVESKSTKNDGVIEMDYQLSEEILTNQENIKIDQKLSRENVGDQKRTLEVRRINRKINKGDSFVDMNNPLSEEIIGDNKSTKTITYCETNEKNDYHLPEGIKKQIDKVIGEKKITKTHQHSEKSVDFLPDHKKLEIDKIFEQSTVHLESLYSTNIGDNKSPTTSSNLTDKIDELSKKRKLTDTDASSSSTSKKSPILGDISKRRKLADNQKITKKRYEKSLSPITKPDDNEEIDYHLPEELKMQLDKVVGEQNITNSHQHTEKSLSQRKLNIFEQSPIDLDTFNFTINGDEKSPTTSSNLTSKIAELGKKRRLTDTTSSSSTSKRVKRFKPPRKLTAKEIRDDFMEQDRKLYETDSINSSEFNKNLQNYINRPSVKQVKNQKQIAIVRKGCYGEAIVEIPTEQVKRKKDSKFKRNWSSDKFNVAMFSDSNAECFDEFLNSKSKDADMFGFSKKIPNPFGDDNNENMLNFAQKENIFGDKIEPVPTFAQYFESASSYSQKRISGGNVFEQNEKISQAKQHDRSNSSLVCTEYMDENQKELNDLMKKYLNSPRKGDPFSKWQF